MQTDGPRAHIPGHRLHLTDTLGQCFTVCISGHWTSRARPMGQTPLKLFTWPMLSTHTGLRGLTVPSRRRYNMGSGPCCPSPLPAAPRGHIPTGPGGGQALPLGHCKHQNLLSSSHLCVCHFTRFKPVVDTFYTRGQEAGRLTRVDSEVTKHEW